jgi:hypothetical protein
MISYALDSTVTVNSLVTLVTKLSGLTFWIGQFSVDSTVALATLNARFLCCNPVSRRGCNVSYFSVQYEKCTYFS